jgi:hypothetical protein
VRLAVLNLFSALVSEVTAARADKVMALVKKLCEDKNWRVRWSAMKQVREFPVSVEMKVTEFNRLFASPPTAEGSTFLRCAKDNCALIRSDFVLLCSQIASVEGYGGAWLVETVLPTVMELKNDKAYQNQSVIALAAKAWCKYLPPKCLTETVLPVVIGFMEDKVPNLKLQAAEALGVVGGYFKSQGIEAEFLASKLKPPLQKAAAADDKEEDMDVKLNSNNALKLME